MKEKSMATKKKKASKKKAGGKKAAGKKNGYGGFGSAFKRSQ
jgi:hypothetical protein